MKFLAVFVIFLIVIGVIFTPMILNLQHHEIAQNENISSSPDTPYVEEVAYMPARVSVPYDTNITKAIEQAVFDYTNRERTLQGIQALENDELLSTIAREHSDDMCTYAYVAHTDSQGNSPTDRAKLAGYKTFKTYGGIDYDGIGENLCAMPYGNVGGYGHIDKYDWDKIAITTVTSLMDSEEHRENILNEGYTHMGVGVVYGYGYYYVTQDFW